MSYAPSIDLGLPLQVRSFPPLSSFNAPPPPAVVGRTLLSSARRPSIDADAVVAVVGYLSITTYQHAPPSSSSDPPSPCRRRHRPSRNHHPDPPPGLLPLRSMPGGKYRGGHVWLDAQEVRRIGHEISVRRRSQRGRQGQDTVVLGCRRRRRCPLPPVAAAILAIDHADAAGLRFVGRCASRRPILVACTPRRRNDGDNRDPRVMDPATILLLLFPHRIALLDHCRSQGRDHVRLSTYPLRPPRMLVPDVDSRRIAVVIPFVAQLSRYYVCAVVNLR